MEVVYIGRLLYTSVNRVFLLDNITHDAPVTSDCLNRCLKFDSVSIERGTKDTAV